VILSELLDRQYIESAEEKTFDTIAKAAKQRNGREIAKREKLVRNLDNDLAEHGDGEKWKRFGDLLLANTGTAKREGENLIVTDYFDEAAPLIEIPAEVNDSITETAEKYFRRYTKARNAAEEIERRKNDVEAELKKLYAERTRIDNAIEAMDADYLITAAGGKKPVAKAIERRNSPRQMALRENSYRRMALRYWSGKRRRITITLRFASRNHWTHGCMRRIIRARMS
jgi:predicted ribosome quality control (RQC) complex YloA/Tae2 family protein